MEDEFWNTADILKFERIRVELRDLMKFIETGRKELIYTDLEDQEQERSELKDFTISYDFQDYRLKVNRYIEEHKNHIAIHKLRNNIPLTEVDYHALEKILTGELGTKGDYERSFKDTPFGLLVRRIVKMERAAAMKAFSSLTKTVNLEFVRLGVS